MRQKYLDAYIGLHYVNVKGAELLKEWIVHF